jgi:hypothetical protein
MIKAVFQQPASLMYRIAVCIWRDKTLEARNLTREYLNINPKASVNVFIQHQSKPLSSVAEKIASALIIAGLPR